MNQIVDKINFKDFRDACLGTKMVRVIDQALAGDADAIEVARAAILLDRAERQEEALAAGPQVTQAELVKFRDLVSLRAQEDPLSYVLDHAIAGETRAKVIASDVILRHRRALNH